MIAPLLVALGLSAAAAPAATGPPELQGIGLDARPGALLPLDAVFTDTEGRSRPLGAWLDDQPTLLVLAYYDCPMLCDVMVREAAVAAAALPAEPAALVVSFDARDTPETARQARGELDWSFLVGGPQEIRRLLDAVGMTIRLDVASGRIAHPAALFVISPSGRVSSVVAGPRPDPRTLARALEDARLERFEQGVIGWVLSCFRWEPTHRTALPAFERFVRIGGVLIFGSFGLLLGRLFLRARP